MSRVFISYRRSDTEAEVASLVSLLQRDGHEVFWDVRMDGGVEFPETIRNALIYWADVVLAIIGPDWIGATNKGKRIEEPNDWVRKEIELALASHKHVIPVFVRDASMPSDLPTSIAPLAFKHGKHLRGSQDYTADYNQIEAMLRTYKGPIVIAEPNLPKFLYTAGPIFAFTLSALALLGATWLIGQKLQPPQCPYIKGRWTASRFDKQQDNTYKVLGPMDLTIDQQACQISGKFAEIGDIQHEIPEGKYNGRVFSISLRRYDKVHKCPTEYRGHITELQDRQIALNFITSNGTCGVSEDLSIDDGHFFVARRVSDK